MRRWMRSLAGLPFDAHARTSMRFRPDARLPTAAHDVRRTKRGIYIRPQVDRPAFIYRARESDRGYESHGSLWSPGYFRAGPLARLPDTLVASTETWKPSAP